MKKIGFLGFGKIGQTIYEEVCNSNIAETVFIQNLLEPDVKQHKAAYIRQYDAALYAQADLIIECATADALEENIENILKNCDVLVFSLTAFSNPEFEQKAKKLAETYQHHIYIPHGAILGLDGILDGASLWNEVSIVTTKNPNSLAGCEAKEKTVLFEGSTREACKVFPRNVNVHAAVALTGIGFDKTVSKIIADPAVHSNTHIITVKGTGVSMELKVSSFSEGGVTGKYTPLSACGSVNRILKNEVMKIV